MYAGPLWRDEVNTANIAQMPSFQELLHESFPPLWLLILRGCNAVGFATSDAGIRVLGLYVGLATLGSLWVAARWMGCRAPVLSIGLLGCLPAFILIMGANRAYGLASFFLVLSFGAVWRVVEQPSRGRILAAGGICVIFAHCVYYDVVFLAAILAGGTLVTLRRRQWKTFWVLVGIGFISAGSLAIYLPTVRQGAPYLPLMQWPEFSFRTIWDELCSTVTPRSSSGKVGPNGPEIWLWIALVLGGITTAFLAQRTRAASPPASKTAQPSFDQRRADRALFCGVSMVLGVAGLMAFLYHLRYWTQSWYYIEALCLCGISLDGLLGANWPGLRPWGLLRAGFMVIIMGWCGKAGWEEAHTRRSNMDLIAAILNQSASKDDFIVVNRVWEGIGFNRYYHGSTAWVTVPPVDSHLEHRYDLVAEKMKDPACIVPVLQEISKTLREGHKVWFVGNMTDLRLRVPPLNLPSTWAATYLIYWDSQISMMLLDHTLQRNVVDVSASEPISRLENLPLVRFAGYREWATNSVETVR